MTHPFDTIKTIQQSNLDSKLGFFNTAKKIGVPNIFKGVTARGGGIIFSITFMNWIKEKLENLCDEKEDSHYKNIGKK